MLRAQSGMKRFIHARLSPEDRAVLDELKRATGRTESALLRLGLQLVVDRERRVASALDLAGASVGRFTGGPRGLSTGRKHLDGFGE